MQHSAACTRTLSASPAPLSLLLLILACSGPQVICGAAYSNTRSRLKRWVGNRNPNGPDLAVSPPTLPPSRPAPPRPRCAALRSRAAGRASPSLHPPARRSLASLYAQAWRRDHSNGDLASGVFCWRLRLEAPPVFVTDLSVCCPLHLPRPPPPPSLQLQHPPPTPPRFTPAPPPAAPAPAAAVTAPAPGMPPSAPHVPRTPPPRLPRRCRPRPVQASCV